jgi:hypothetical protein
LTPSPPAAQTELRTEFSILVQHSKLAIKYGLISVLSSGTYLYHCWTLIATTTAAGTTAVEKETWQTLNA